MFIFLIFLETSLKPDQPRASQGSLQNSAQKVEPTCVEFENSQLEKCDSKTFIQQFAIKEESPTNNMVQIIYR